MKNIKNIIYAIILLALVFGGGFWFGWLSNKQEVPEQTIIKWEDGDVVSGEVAMDEVTTTETTPSNVVLPNDIFKAMSGNTPIDPVVGLSHYPKDCDGKQEQRFRQSNDNDSLHIYRAVYVDYIKIRKDHVSIFDIDTLGTLTVDASIQFNRSHGYGYDFKPRIKTISNNFKPKPITFTPFVSSSYSTTDYLGVGGGFFYHNLGFEYQYQIDLRHNNISYEPRGNAHLLGIKYKFR